ncbi:MAG: hypothetical protein V4689_22600 [Verrucomicrobiota bacterium]
MNEHHHASLTRYLNDMIAVERDIANAIRLQTADEEIDAYPELRSILLEIVLESEERIRLLKILSEKEGGSIGAAVKEGITTVTGVFAGLYGRVREHPVSRMVRDDIVALDVAATGYGMLLTLGLAIGHQGCAEIAARGLVMCPQRVLRLTHLLPEIVYRELSRDAPLDCDPAAVATARDQIRTAWRVE